MRISNLNISRCLLFFSLTLFQIFVSSFGVGVKKPLLFHKWQNYAVFMFRRSTKQSLYAVNSVIFRKTNFATIYLYVNMHVCMLENNLTALKSVAGLRIKLNQALHRDDI